MDRFGLFTWCVCLSKREGWYSFEMGPVHFLVMDTELSCDPGSPQYSFFEKDLASVNRTSTPWVVFAGMQDSAIFDLYCCYVCCFIHISESMFLL